MISIFLKELIAHICEYMGGWQGQKPQNRKSKFINLLILENLKNYFIGHQNKFSGVLNGLKILKLTILRSFV